MKVRIENSYTDGHESESIVDVEDPPAGLDADALEEWFADTCFPHTGDGHYTDVYEATGGKVRLGSCYTATVVETSNPAMVDYTYEWLD